MSDVIIYRQIILCYWFQYKFLYVCFTKFSWNEFFFSFFLERLAVAAETTTEINNREEFSVLLDDYIAECWKDETFLYYTSINIQNYLLCNPHMDIVFLYSYRLTPSTPFSSFVYCNLFELLNDLHFCLLLFFLFWDIIMFIRLCVDLSIVRFSDCFQF